MMRRARGVFLILTIVAAMAGLAACAGNMRTGAFQADVTASPVPWTRGGIPPTDDRLQFAILADRNGGYRPGVFADAIAHLNQLQPEFVMCVGDLIEGYTRDPEIIQAMYADLDAELALLERPFFFVPGNHDLTNDTLIAEYKARRGRLYYHFTHRNALFLSLDSEDPSQARISSDQVAYVRQTLAQHKDVRWTFVFLHHPLWAPESAETVPDSAWLEIEALLADRPYTVFAGHTHVYAKHVRNGRDYYVLATTGGGSSLTGPSVGEFDHLTWVTLGSEGPRVSLIPLGAFIPNDILTETTVGQMRNVFGNVRTRINSIMLHDGMGAKALTEVALSNRSEADVVVTLFFPSNDVLQVSPSHVRLETAAGSQKFSPLEVIRLQPEADMGLPYALRGSAAYEVVLPGEQSPRTWQQDARIVLDRPSAAPRRSSPVSVDGDLREWSTLPEAWSGRTPLMPPDERAWQGEEDCSYRFAVQHDDAYLYIAVDVRDDDVLVRPGQFPWQQDSIEVRLDVRADPDRSLGEGKNEFQDLLLMAPIPGQRDAQVYGFDKLPSGTRIACARTATGYAAEWAVPIAYLDAVQGKSWTAVRVNVAVNDLDGDTIRQCWWRPDWRGPMNYMASGTFERR
ncbi:MAG TPA: sugar-binding protein [Candidatus Hydrogenedentes bacterium]|nr:sugar-binding protein [Candidatus Hydrogenedentota bacterium]